MKRHRFVFPNFYLQVFKNNFNKILLKHIKNHGLLNYHIRQKAYINIMLINNRHNSNKLQIFCIFTGRIKFTLSKFKVSRMIFKLLLSLRHYSGIYKSSW